MERVQGIGGVFFKARDVAALGAWYRDHLGVPLEEWGGCVFNWKANNPDGDAHTVWGPFAADTEYFEPSKKDFMVNFRVNDLAAIRQQLIDQGCDVDARTEESEHGKFGWVVDPEGNKVELWEPPA